MDLKSKQSESKSRLVYKVHMTGSKPRVVSLAVMAWGLLTMCRKMFGKIPLWIYVNCVGMVYIFTWFHYGGLIDKAGSK